MAPKSSAYPVRLARRQAFNPHCCPSGEQVNRRYSTAGAELPRNVQHVLRPGVLSSGTTALASMGHFSGFIGSSRRWSCEPLGADTHHLQQWGRKEAPSLGAQCVVDSIGVSLPHSIVLQLHRQVGRVLMPQSGSPHAAMRSRVKLGVKGGECSSLRSS